MRRLPAIILIALCLGVLFISNAEAALDMGFQNAANGRWAPQEINQTLINKPYLSEDNNTNEMVDPQTGALILKQNDITLPGKDGLDFSLARIYNSSQAVASRAI